MMSLTACGGAPDTPTGPSSAVATPPAPMTGIVQGIVRSGAYFTVLFVREAPISGAQVTTLQTSSTSQALSLNVRVVP
jgi:hypothetical protein